MNWVTRAGIHVDRAATAWLITSYIDPEATFSYVDSPHYRGVENGHPAGTPFDMPGCDLSHHGNDITFETVLRRYELHDPVLWRLAEIIHEADLQDDRFDAPEAPGLDTIIRALGVDHNDEEVRALSAAIFTSLYQYLRQETLGSLP